MVASRPGEAEPMTFAAILASYLALGTVAGTMAGLFGVGGGL